MSRIPSFAVISGAQVLRTISGKETQISRSSSGLPTARGGGDSQPRFVLPAFPRPALCSDHRASRLGQGRGRCARHQMDLQLPGELIRGHPTGLGLLILNDTETGYPFACLEGSVISAARTAASAALAAVRLSTARGGPRPDRIGFVGVGIIARYIHTYLAASGFDFEVLGVNDRCTEHAEGFREYLARSESGEIVIHDDPERLIRSSDM